MAIYDEGSFEDIDWTYFVYHGKKLDLDFHLVKQEDFIKEAFNAEEIYEHDFGMASILKQHGQRLYDAVDAYLKIHGWERIGSLGRFKGRGCVSIHDDIGAVGDRFDEGHKNPRAVYNACMVLKIFETVAEDLRLDEDEGGSDYAREGGITFIAQHGGSGDDYNKSDPLYHAINLKEGDTLLFDQNLKHGIMTNNGYWLLIFMVAKTGEDYGD